MGGFVTYQLESQHDRYRIHDVELIQVPARWVLDDIMFLHHCLEIAFYFLPEHSNSDKIFSLFTFLYSEYVSTITMPLVKKLFLAKFFALLGIYPDFVNQDATKNGYSLFCALSQSEGIALDIHNNIDELHEQLRLWLVDCINTHPDIRLFNTVQFLQ